MGQGTKARIGGIEEYNNIIGNEFNESVDSGVASERY